MRNTNSRFIMLIALLALAGASSAVTTTTAPVNTITTVIVIAILILSTFIAAKVGKVILVGEFGGLLLILLGVWIASSGIMVQTGEKRVRQTSCGVFLFSKQ